MNPSQTSEAPLQIHPSVPWIVWYHRYGTFFQHWARGMLKRLLLYTPLMHQGQYLRCWKPKVTPPPYIQGCVPLTSRYPPERRNPRQHMMWTMIKKRKNCSEHEFVIWRSRARRRLITLRLWNEMICITMITTTSTMVLAMMAGLPVRLEGLMVACMMSILMRCEITIESEGRRRKKRHSGRRAATSIARRKERAQVSARLMMKGAVRAKKESTEVQIKERVAVQLARTVVIYQSRREERRERSRRRPSKRMIMVRSSRAVPVREKLLVAKRRLIPRRII
mmetsp:Transcript_35366/g.77465  ORF Transcript_35366/g.77465 Transcript_35366/m.77465 type:complete len:280 (-) Transcript_35366:220-1059(-)